MTSPTTPPCGFADPAQNHDHTAPPTAAQPPRRYRGWHRQPGHPARTTATVAAIGGFVGAVLAANMLTARYGLIPVGAGLTATAGTFAAGYTLLARDIVQHLAGRAAVLACIGAGAAATAAVAGAHLALASAAAFTVSELVDLAIYQPLRRRGFIRAALASNAVGAPTDSIVFLALARFPIFSSLPGQLWAKTLATVVPAALFVVTRALLRHRLRPSSP